MPGVCTLTDRNAFPASHETDHSVSRNVIATLQNQGIKLNFFLCVLVEKAHTFSSLHTDYNVNRLIKMLCRWNTSKRREVLARTANCFTIIWQFTVVVFKEGPVAGLFCKRDSCRCLICVYTTVRRMGVWIVLCFRLGCSSKDYRVQTSNPECTINSYWRWFHLRAASDSNV